MPEISKPTFSGIEPAGQLIVDFVHVLQKHAALMRPDSIPVRVNRHGDFDLFFQIDSDQVHVQHFNPQRIPLQIADQRRIFDRASQLDHLAVVTQQRLKLFFRDG